MKAIQFLFFGVFGSISILGHSQATTANSTNTVTITSYLGSGATSNFDVIFRRNNIAAGRLGTTVTNFGVNSLSTSPSLPSSVAIGVNAGQFASGTGFNTYIGQNAGKGQSGSILNTGSFNTFLGFEAGSRNTSGVANVFLGYSSGKFNTTGSSNIFIGDGVADGMTTGNGNVFIGSSSGNENNGNFNILLGNDAGSSTLGSNNIMIGNNAGADLITDNKLIIENLNAANPLIFGDFQADHLKFHGKVGIGGNSTTAFGNFPINSGGVNVSAYNLFVKGGILTDEVRVSTTWADYVFCQDYQLPTLQEVEKHIQEKGHLINVPSAKQVEENGIELGEMAKIQQEKIEELTLYIIAQNKLILELSNRLTALEKR